MFVTSYSCLRDTRPVRQASCTWQALARALTSPRARAADKTSMPMWSPVRLMSGRTRANDAVVDIHALVLDVDGGAAPAMVHASLEGIAYIWHTTYSSTRETPRMRIVARLAMPVDAARWRGVVAEAHRRWAFADPSCKDPSRAYYVPCPGGDGSWDCGVVDGAPLDVSGWRAAPRVPVRRGASVLAIPSCAGVELRERRNDPSWRARRAAEVGASIHGEYARGAACPSCGRRSAWWALSPEKMVRAACSHRNSCGWTGHLEELT